MEINELKRIVRQVMNESSLSRTHQHMIAHNCAIITAFRYEKHYYHVVNNLDWHEWSIDTTMMKQFSNNLILVIGKRDEYIDVDPNSEAMQLCRVIYTDTVHGWVVFSNFYNDL